MCFWTHTFSNAWRSSTLSCWVSLQIRTEAPAGNPQSYFNLHIVVKQMKLFSRPCMLFSLPFITLHDHNESLIYRRWIRQAVIEMLTMRMETSRRTLRINSVLHFAAVFPNSFSGCRDSSRKSPGGSTADSSGSFPRLCVVKWLVWKCETQWSALRDAPPMNYLSQTKPQVNIGLNIITIIFD